MKLLNNQKRSEWVERVGGIKQASLLILNKLECSISKAEKLAAGRYPSELSPSEQKGLASLMRTSREALFLSDDADEAS